MPLISSIISYTLFADDTTGIYSSSSLDDLFQSTQTELDKLNTWFRSNKLFINVNKTNFMLFSSKQKEKYITLDNNIHNLKISSSIINCRDEVKFLGLLLDKNLSFKSHLKFLCKKVLKGIYAISRAAKILPSVSLTTLYSALILPYLNYGLLIWGGTSYLSEFNYVILDRGYMGNNMKHLTNLHKLQKRAIRLISKAKRRSHHIPLCHNLNILDLKDLYIIKALSFFHDFYHQKLPPAFHNIFTLYLSRNEQLMIKPKHHRTNIAAASLIHTLPSIWNSLDNNLKQNITLSKSSFLSKCKAHLIESYKTWSCDTPNYYSCNYLAVLIV